MKNLHLSEGIKHWALFFDVIEAKRDVMLVVTSDGDVMVMSCWCHASELSFLSPFQSEFCVHDSLIFSLLQIYIWIISQLHTSYSSVILWATWRFLAWTLTFVWRLQPLPSVGWNGPFSFSLLRVHWWRSTNLWALKELRKKQQSKDCFMDQLT